MAKKPKSAPSWCKWWMEDWRFSSFRLRLKTPALRGIYREFWDFCMSCPNPGRAVDSANHPYTRTEIATEIGCRLVDLNRMLDVAIHLGRVVEESTNSMQRNPRARVGGTPAPVLSLRRGDAEKSLPDHWKYKRLRPDAPECDQNAVRIRTRLGRGRGKQTLAGAPPPADPPSDPKPPKPAPYRQLTDYFCERWEDEHERKFPFDENSGKNGAHFRAVWTAAGEDIDTARRLIDRFFAEEDEFFAGHPLAIFAAETVLTRYVAEDAHSEKEVESKAARQKRQDNARERKLRGVDGG